MAATLELAAQLELLTGKQTARLIGVNAQTLATWRMLGKGPKYIKLGRLVRYRRTDLAAWVEAAAKKK